MWAVSHTWTLCTLFKFSLCHCFGPMVRFEDHTSVSVSLSHSVVFLGRLEERWILIGSPGFVGQGGSKPFDILGTKNNSTGTGGVDVSPLRGFQGRGELRNYVVTCKSHFTFSWERSLFVFKTKDTYLFSLSLAVRCAKSSPSLFGFIVRECPSERENKPKCAKNTHQWQSRADSETTEKNKNVHFRPHS